MAKSQADELRELCEADCWAFARYVLPHYSFGDIHKLILQSMGDEHRHEEFPNRLYLVSRDHLKSVCLATYACWRIARDPCYTILYLCADEGLGRLQMSFMQNIFESDHFRALWPQHFSPEAGRRDKWTGLAVNSDHPARAARSIRDETIIIRTIKSGNTGRHPDEIMYDDLCVPENSYTELGRTDVRTACAQAVSLAKTSSLMTAVGTVYHPRDQYALWEESEYDDYDREGNFIATKRLWKIERHAVETAGDGSGQYLWPRVYNEGLKQWFGWDRKALAKKKAEYYNNGEKASFYAQYYLEPNDPSSNRLSYDGFQYFNPLKLVADRQSGRYTYDGKVLSIIAAMDVAATDAATKNAAKADFTAIAVVAVDTDGYYYLLALEQFQTDQRSVYADHVIQLYHRWGFKKILVESDGVGKIVAEGLKDSIRERGLTLIVEGASSPRGLSKVERHVSLTIPRFEAGHVFLQKGGYTEMLIDQLVMARPSHDDLLDALTIALQGAHKPSNTRVGWTLRNSSNVIVANKRFGGRR